MEKNPYSVIKRRLISEKASMLSRLMDAESNKSLRRFKKAKYIFVVDINANKHEIKSSIEEIYKKKNIKVDDVNIIVMKPKKKVFKGKIGKTKRKKKAIVTLRKGDIIDQKEG